MKENITEKDMPRLLVKLVTFQFSKSEMMDLFRHCKKGELCGPMLKFCGMDDRQLLKGENYGH